MREIVLDTETTGLDPKDGHRIVEIGCVELMNHIPTGRDFHQYINPKRNMPTGAYEVHGLSEEFLSDKPVFGEIAQAFLDFIGDAKLVIHNAAFDMRFLNAELRWADKAELPMNQAIDTLQIAREKFPGAQNSLDALCRRFGVDNSARTKHGALLDSEILAEVYLELIGGRQPNFALTVISGGRDVQLAPDDWVAPARPKKLPKLISEEEARAHADFVEGLGDGAIWRKYQDEGE